MRSPSGTATAGTIIAALLAIACGSQDEGPTDSSPAQPAPDASARHDTSMADAASSSDGPSGLAVLGDARTLPPDTRKCRPEWADSNSCECIRTAPSAEDVAECSAASVLSSPLELGLCCEDSFGCECIAYGCASSTSAGICHCGRAGTAGLPADSIAVHACPTLSASQKCCLYAFAGTCICSSMACTADGQEVPSCDTAAVAQCDSGAAMWTTCK